MKTHVLLSAFLLSCSALVFAQSNITFTAPDGIRMSIALGNSGTFNGNNNPVNQNGSYQRFDHVRAGNYTVSIRIMQNNSFFPITSIQNITINNGFETSYFVFPQNNTVLLFKVNDVAISNNNNGGWNNGGWNQTPHNWQYLNKMLITDADVASIKAHLQRQPFDDRKLKMLKRIVKDACVSTRQVKDLMSTFVFDDKKLAFAKLAYNSVTDPYNYYQLSDCFSIGSNYDELEDYIASL